MITKIVTEATEFRGFDGKGWTCDQCGEIIEKARDGWVEWFRGISPRKIGEGLRLVHHLSASPRKAYGTGCQYDGHDRAYWNQNLALNDLPLANMVGPNGLMRLLALLAQDCLPKAEVLEMIKRLHVPGYESARLYMDEARSQGVYEPNTFEGKYPFQSDIEGINEWAANRDE